MNSKLSFLIPSSKPKSKPKPNNPSSPSRGGDANQNAAAFDSEAKAKAATTTSKLSFAIPSSRARPRPRPGGDGAQNGEENKSKFFVTEFDSAKTLDADPDKGNAAIPPIQNTWHPVKKMKNLELPLTEAANGEAIGFVVESLPTAGDGRDEGISYGLNVREKSGRDGGGEGGGETERMLLDKLRYDMENLPEHRGMEEFEDRPVEGFGAALLAGYGWKEGQGIGRNAKEDVKVKQYEKRAGKLGLGFVPDKPGAVASVSNGNSKDRDRYNEKSRDHRKDERESDSRKERAGRRVAWLRRQIRVKVVSKKLKRGKLYLKKGVVVDVVEPHVCDISMDGSGELVQGVDQDWLETALPRTGGGVLVLYGEHKGVYGSLIRKDSDRGVVEDSNTLELLNVKLGQVAEYVGDPSYE